MNKNYKVFNIKDITRAVSVGKVGDIITYEPEGNQKGIALYAIVMKEGKKDKQYIGDMNGIIYDEYNVDYDMEVLPYRSSSSSSGRKRSRGSSSSGRSYKKGKYSSGGRKRRTTKKQRKTRGRKTKRHY